MGTCSAPCDDAPSSRPRASGTHIAAPADALELERMALDVETRAQALEQDLVNASDFAR